MIWQLFGLALLLGFIIGFIVGAYIYWGEYQPILRRNRRELMDSYKEQDRLRMVIYSLENNLPIRQKAK